MQPCFLSVYASLYLYNICLYQKKVSDLEFTMVLPAKPEKIFEIITDYENIIKFFPAQLQEIKIINKSKNETITQEAITISSIIKKNFTQKTKHSILRDFIIESLIIEGPLEGTLLRTELQKENEGTKVLVTFDIKTRFMYKMLTPLIKKEYKNIMRAFFYKVNTLA